jgi:hypothetical protein
MRQFAIFFLFVSVLHFSNSDHTQNRLASRSIATADTEVVPVEDDKKEVKQTEVADDEEKKEDGVALDDEEKDDEEKDDKKEDGETAEVKADPKDVIACELKNKFGNDVEEKLDDIEFDEIVDFIADSVDDKVSKKLKRLAQEEEEKRQEQTWLDFLTLRQLMSLAPPMLSPAYYAPPRTGNMSYWEIMTEGKPWLMGHSYGPMFPSDRGLAPYSFGSSYSHQSAMDDYYYGSFSRPRVTNHHNYYIMPGKVQSFERSPAEQAADQGTPRPKPAAESAQRTTEGTDFHGRSGFVFNNDEGKWISFNGDWRKQGSYYSF